MLPNGYDEAITWTNHGLLSVNTISLNAISKDIQGTSL